MIDLIADARRRYVTALVLYRNVNNDNNNLSLAEASLRDIISTFADIEPKPQIYNEAKEAHDKICLELKERIEYLKNNAQVANKAGDTEALKKILVKIMTLTTYPTQEDYIWAKKRLLYISGIIQDVKK